ncbi:MAG: heat-shock protein [Flavobacteriaceae bacterium]|nr:heat-shock protein [Flavobacteriaceae bacterium]|tara:strand:- start:501 stop:1157 length:657 start_codon:yes stop_codon:yes gene_type:complete
MAKKTKINKENLVALYMDAVLDHNEVPQSVYSFAKMNHFEESEFYRFFGSFEALEAAIYELFFEKTMKTLEKSKEYKDYDAMNQLLSFYFTFFGNLTANRSYVSKSLQMEMGGLNQMKKLKTLRQKFLNFIDELDLGVIDIKNKRIDDIKDSVVNESYWIQMLVTLKFWLDDDSADFEKTDLFIEKSIAASFELANTKPLKSVVDFGKFLFKEKISMR